MDDELVTGRLDHMLVVGHALRRLGIAQLVDERCPADPRSRVSHGQCVEALIVAILSGSHTLYRINELLEPYDLPLAFDWPHEVHHFHDNRLARALSCVFEAGITPMFTAAVVRAVAVYELELSRIHLDTSSVAVHGAYQDGEEPEDPDDPQAVPKVERGYSREHRPDLKQVVYGLSVTADGAVPVFGRVASGGRNDNLEGRFMVGQLKEVLPDPSATTLVGDSKLFSGETLLLAQEYRFHVLTMLPRSTGLWDEAFHAYRAFLAGGGKPTLLKATYPKQDEEAARPTQPEKVWQGRSFPLVYAWEDEDRTTHEIPLRALFVESSSLREQKSAAVHGRRDKALQRLERAVAVLDKQAFNCEPDARVAAEDLVRTHGSNYHVVHHEVVQVHQRKKRSKPGRPRKDEPVQYDLVWKVRCKVEEDPSAIEAAILREGSFVLITTRAEDEYPDERAFREYQEQNKVEQGIRWTKGPLAVRPVFLKTEGRIAALGFVYALALMVYALIQRDVRRLLRDAGTTFPGNKGHTKKPTTEVIFRLFEGINTVRVGSSRSATITNLTTPQVEALQLIGHPVLTNPFVTLTTPRQPRRGARGYRPPRPDDDPPASW